MDNWVIVAGLLLLLIFIVARPHRYGPGGMHWYGPGGMRRYGPGGMHRYGPGGMRHWYGPGGVEGFSSSMSPTLYMFGWAQCGHCKTAKPEFDKLKETIGDRVHCQYIEGPENPDMTQEYGVEGYPTFWFVNGPKKVKYEGERTAEGLREFCDENM